MRLTIRWIRVRAKHADGTVGHTLVEIPLPWLRRRAFNA